jgi:hypothetical protein
MGGEVMELSLDDLQSLMQEVGDIDPEARAYPDYSGRFMSGAECFGIACGSPAKAMAGIVMWSKDNDHNIEPFLSDVREDELGKEMILYFPKVSVSEQVIAQWKELTE